MSGFFTGILKICLLLSAPVARVSGQDVNEERIDQSLPFNKSLLIYTEASQNLENVTRTIADLNEAIKETTKLKNEVVKSFFHQIYVQVSCEYFDLRIFLIINEKSDDFSLLQAVSVWLSWMMANSLCEGGLNMTEADSLWRQSRYRGGTTGPLEISRHFEGK